MLRIKINESNACSIQTILVGKISLNKKIVLSKRVADYVPHLLLFPRKEEEYYSEKISQSISVS